MATEQQKIRYMGQDRSPIWLRGKNAATLIYVLGRLLDRILDGAVAAVKHRFPGYYSFDGLNLTGRERGLRRGIFETDQGYADRLVRYLDASQVRGSPTEMLTQLYYFHRPELWLAASIIERSGHRYTMGTGTSDQPGTIVEDRISGWNPDSHPERWATYTIIIYGMPVYAIAPLPIQQRALQDLKALVQDFNPARCKGTIVVYAGTGDDLWGALPAPPGHPEITEGLWGDGSSLWGAETSPFVIDFV